MHKEILNNEQLKLLKELKIFKKDFYLAGGTSLALQIGHRKSIDFDLFKNGLINSNSILKNLNQKKLQRTLVRNIDQFTIIYSNVNLTFLNYPFGIEPLTTFEDIFKTVDILTIGAMKAYALGRRSKWKDYVDLYFILQKYSLKELIQKSENIFANLWNTKLFLEQLAYFEDIDYSEEVEFIGVPIENTIIKDKLRTTAISF